MPGVRYGNALPVPHTFDELALGAGQHGAVLLGGVEPDLRVDALNRAGSQYGVGHPDGLQRLCHQI